MIKGRRDQLVGRIQERYGLAREAVEERLREFENRYNTTSMGSR